MSDTSDDRRRESRQLSCIPAYIGLKDETQHLALIRDVSPGGARLFVRTKLAVGEVVHLQLYLSGDDKQARPASGLVVRCEPRSGPRDVWQYDVAVEFETSIDDYASEIADLTRRQDQLGLFK